MPDFPTCSDFKNRPIRMPLLILPIKLFWLKKIWREEKKEEYREIKPYYEKRLEKSIDFPLVSAGFRAGDRPDSPFLVRMCKIKKANVLKNWEREKSRKCYILKIRRLYDFF